jgi:hypothetical protein
MTLDQLIAWLDEAVARMRVSSDTAHVRRMYARLDGVGVDWAFRTEWHKLACNVAKKLGESAPPFPSEPGARSKRKRRLPEPDPPPPTTSRKRGGPASRPASVPRRRAPRPQPLSIEVNPQLQAAFNAVAAGRPIVFVTGGAGTGKSTFIRELRARFPERNSVVLAPTGVAALTAGGQTIHSFCNLPLRPFVAGDAKPDDERRDILRALDLMVIDEISMVRADTLDGVDEFLRVNRESNETFAGVQLVLVGDLFQLPPVVTARDQPLLADRYASPYFFAAHALKGRTFRPIVLETVYRQNDASFAALLASIRDGEGVEEAVRQLNDRCAGRPLDGRHLILTPRRDAAATSNERELAALKGRAWNYEAQREGSFAHVPEDRLPAPARLALKKNAQVMFVRNDPERRWVNGTIGVVTELTTERIRVQTDDDIHDVEPVEWQDIEYSYDRKEKKIVDEVAGTYTQFPLMPAWAVTIHKAQGLTLARVEVDLDRGAFAEGQVYVALSRCQTLEGLSLRRPIRPWEVRTSAAARQFYAKFVRR